MKTEIIRVSEKESIFFNGYLEAITFTEGCVKRSLDETFLRESLIDCLCYFNRTCCYMNDEQFEQAGIDFWLSRNGHGSGFFDKTDFYNDGCAERFQKIAESFGSVTPFFDDIKE